MTVIGNEGGFLPAAFVVPGGAPLLLAPAERADVLVDFSGVPAGTYIVRNDAPAPYPTGVGESPVPEWMVRACGKIVAAALLERGRNQRRLAAAFLTASRARTASCPASRLPQAIIVEPPTVPPSPANTATVALPPPGAALAPLPPLKCDSRYCGANPRPITLTEVLRDGVPTPLLQVRAA
jgi:hypothetical protein